MKSKRKSLTIREANDIKIQHIRSQFLLNNIEIDYTTMVNIFIELGDMAFKPGTYSITDIADIFKKHLEDNIDSKIILNVLKEYHATKVKEEDKDMTQATKEEDKDVSA